MIKKIVLKDSEYIVAVVPQFVSGPGWSNAIAWVLVHDPVNDTYREECIQPEERSDALNTLFGIGAYVTLALKDSIPVKKTKP
jgi:hypothetical protein